MFQQQCNGIWAVAIYFVSTRTHKRYGRAAGLFSFNVFKKIILATGRMRAATLENRSPMGPRRFNMPSKVLLELERPVTL